MPRNSDPKTVVKVIRKTSTMIFISYKAKKYITYIYSRVTIQVTLVLHRQENNDIRKKSYFF